MNKSELIEAVAARLGEGRSVATKAVDAVFDEIQRTVSKGERVAVTGFGVFEKRDRAARTARNPATGATVKVKKTSVPAFRAGQGFKDVVTGARKLAKVVAPAAARATGAARSTAASATKATRGAAKPVATRAAAKPAAKAAAKKVTTRAAAKPAAARKTVAKAVAAKATKATKATKAPAAKAVAAKATKAPAAKAIKAAKPAAAKKAAKKR